MFDAACVPQVTTHNWPTLDWNFCVPGTWVATTEGSYSGQTVDMNAFFNNQNAMTLIGANPFFFKSSYT